MSLFAGTLQFTIHPDLFWELAKHPDTGFGFEADLDIDKLSELQIEALNFLIRCQKKKLMGSVTIAFKLNGIGEINDLSRQIEKIVKSEESYTISATY